MSIFRTALFAPLLALAAPGFAAEEVSLLQHSLEDVAPGQEGHMLLVRLQPGESAPVHRHNAHAFVYVLSGRLRMAVNGGEPRELVAGDTFYEAPGDVHTVTENLEDAQPAELLVVFVKHAGAAHFEAVE